MKFAEGWQVDVVRPGNATAYADIGHGADKYVVGVPGQPFEVRITPPVRHFDRVPETRVELAVEGRSVGVAKIMKRSHPVAVFEGFVNTVKGQHLNSQFLFGKAETDAAAPAVAPGSSKTGGLHIKCIQMQQLPGHQEPPRQVSYQGAGLSKTVEGCFSL